MKRVRPVTSVGKCNGIRGALFACSPFPCGLSFLVCKRGFRVLRWVLLGEAWCIASDDVPSSDGFGVCHG